MFLKDQIDAAVKILLDLKAEFKKVSGLDWKPDFAKMKTVEKVSPVASDTKQTELNDKIVTQGNKIRQLKAGNAAKVISSFFFLFLIFFLFGFFF